jgi:hypothetical protein
MNCYVGRSSYAVMQHNVCTFRDMMPVINKTNMAKYRNKTAKQFPSYNYHNSVLYPSPVFYLKHDVSETESSLDGKVDCLGNAVI